MQQNDISTMQARALRHAMTPAERALWQALRDRRFMGLKFRRQVPLGPCIAEFFCAERGLILEVDSAARDLMRDRWLQDKGFRTLRLSDRDILGSLPACLERIAVEIVP